MWITKKQLKKQVAELSTDNERLSSNLEALTDDLHDVLNQLSDYKTTYPFTLGQVVYDLQLRSSKGRFTKTKASREHSLINEVVVDKKNYFNLVERFNNSDVFVTFVEADKYLNSVCVE